MTGLSSANTRWENNEKEAADVRYLAKVEARVNRGVKKTQLPQVVYRKDNRRNHIWEGNWGRGGAEFANDQNVRLTVEEESRRSAL